MMNFKNITMSLLMMCAVVQTSTSDKKLVPVTMQQVRVENQEKSNGRRVVSCINCGVMTVGAVSLTAGAFALSLMGWNAYERQLLYADVANLPNQVNACVAQCSESDLPCYETCAQEMFSEKSADFVGCRAIRDYRKKLGQHYNTCTKRWRKKSDNEVFFTSEECVEKVLEQVVHDENLDASYKLPEDAVHGPIDLVEMIKVAWLFVRAAGA